MKSFLGPKSAVQRFAMGCWMFAFGLTSLAEVHAASIFLNPPPGWNGMFISAKVYAGWYEDGGLGADVVDSSSFLLASTFPPRVPGETLTGTSLFLNHLPDSGAPKDKAEVQLDYSVVVGDATAGSSDAFFFRIQGTTSAVLAKHDFGLGLVNANAFIAVEVDLVIPAPVPAASLARFGFPALPSLTTLPPNIESLSANGVLGPFFGPPTGTWTMGPGDAGFSIPISLDPATTEQFSYKLRYSLLTPFGTDPSIDLSLQGKLETATVPEPGSLLIVSSSLLLLSIRRRKQIAGNDENPPTAIAQ